MKPKNGESHMKCKNCGKEFDLSKGQQTNRYSREGWIPSQVVGDLCNEFSRIVCADCSYYRYWFND